MTVHMLKALPGEKWSHSLYNEGKTDLTELVQLCPLEEWGGLIPRFAAIYYQKKLQLSMPPYQIHIVGKYGFYAVKVQATKSHLYDDANVKLSKDFKLLSICSSD